MKYPLKQYASIQFGNYYRPHSKGVIAYLQAKNFDDHGRFLNNVDAFIKPDELNPAHLLKDRDILFVGKGFRNFAWSYNESAGPVVASSIFFIIRIVSPLLLPEYLTTIFNLPSNQSYFQRLGAGSSIPSIRKNELAEFPINQLSIEYQQKIIDVNDLYSNEMEINQSLMLLKTELFQSVITKLSNQ